MDKQGIRLYQVSCPEQFKDGWSEIRKFGVGWVEKHEIEGSVTVSQVFDDIPVLKLSDVRRQVCALAGVSKILLEIPKNPPVTLDKNCASCPSAQSFQSIGSGSGKKIEDGFFRDEFAQG